MGMKHMWHTVLSSRFAWGPVIIYFENICEMGCIWLSIKKGWDLFLSLQSLSRLPVMTVTFWFIYLIWNCFLSLLSLWRDLLDLEEILFLISFQHCPASSHSFTAQLHDLAYESILLFYTTVIRHHSTF